MPLQEFVLDGFGGGPQTQALLSALFLVLYLVDVLGNLTMIVVITLDARLHSSVFLSRETRISGNFVGRIKGAKCPFDLQFLTWDFS